MLAAYPQFYGWKGIASVIVYPDDKMGPAICWVLKGTMPVRVLSNLPHFSRDELATRR